MFWHRLLQHKPILTSIVKHYISATCANFAHMPNQFVQNMHNHHSPRQKAKYCNFVTLFCHAELFYYFCKSI